MTHKEFAAQWRATRRSRVLMAAVAIIELLVPLAALLYLIESSGLSRALERGTLNTKFIWLTTGLTVGYVILVMLTFFLGIRRLFRRNGFLCPGCDRTFVGWNFRQILSGGHCCFCGERVLQEDPARPALGAVEGKE